MVPLGSALAWWTLSGCYSGFDTAGGQLHLDPTDTVVVEPYVGLIPNDTSLMEGTEVCAAITCSDQDATCPKEIDVASCFDQSAEGGSISGDGCALAETAGTFVWHFDPVADVAACGADPGTYAPAPDSVSFEVVAATEVTPVLLQWAERGAEASLVAAAGSFPDDWRVPDGQPFQVVDGGLLRLPVAFQRDSDARIVAWDTAAVDLEVVTTAGDEPAVTFPQPGWVALTPVAGGTSEVRVRDGTEEWVAGTIVGVEPEVASIEVVVALTEDGDGITSPLAARAVLRDGSGTLVYGAPLTWTLADGDLLVETSDTDLPGPDYVLLEDACVAPPTDAPETRTATLEASFGGLTGSATFDWVAPVSTAPFAPDPACAIEPPGSAEQGCTCGGGGAPGWGLGMLLAALARRRPTRSP